MSSSSPTKSHFEEKATSHSNTNIYSRYRLPSTTTTNSADSFNSSMMDDNITIDHKRSYTVDNLNSLAYFSCNDNELTPSAAIRDRYYQSSRYLSDNDTIDEEDIIYEEEKIDGDVFDYRPGAGEYYTKPTITTPSIYSVNDSVISLRTEYNNNDDNRSIASIRTVDDRLQGRSSLLGANLNSFAQKTAKKVSRSSSIFRQVGDKRKSKLQPFSPERDTPPVSSADNTSIRTIGGSSLLSKLSKSTAPMRAKLSAISSLTKHSRIDAFSSSSSSLAVPGRKRMAESVYNMPISSPSPQQQRKPKVVEKAQSFIMIPKSLSASSSTSSMITSSVMVEEPGSVKDTAAVYPALLSKIAEAFQERIVTSTRTKDSIKYKDAFDGKEAVDKLAFIIKSNDRNLALLLGRALDAQKFFHDVNYEHRLRDSSQELYQFKEHLNMRPKSGVIVPDSTSEFNVFLSVQEKDYVIPLDVLDVKNNKRDNVDITVKAVILTWLHNMKTGYGSTLFLNLYLKV